MRRARITLLAVLILLATAYDYGQILIWDGGYHVRVKVEQQSARRVGRMSAVVLFRQGWEEAEGDPSRIDVGWKAVPTSEPFEVLVNSSGRISGFGRELGYVRQEVLVLKVEYADGQRTVVAADVPDSGNPELVVRVP
jgi:hypothetical protein